MLADLTSNFITSAGSTLEQLSYRWGQLPQSSLLHPKHGISAIALISDHKRTAERVADRDRPTLALPQPIIRSPLMIRTVNAKPADARSRQILSVIYDTIGEQFEQLGSGFAR